MNNSESGSVGTNATNEGGPNPDYYRLLMENNLSKVASLTVTAVSVLISQILSFGIIWFEKFGSDAKRTLMNRFVALGCWSTVFYLFLILIPQYWTYLVRPLPEWWCFWTAIIRNAIFYNIVLYFDSMAVIR